MDNVNISDLGNLIDKIEAGKILLPDFQREFVWKDVEQQKQIVASVLARMPIGSILLLKSSNVNEFSSKALGKRHRVDTGNLIGDVEFLLDGQQRMTVLANVFSNVLYKEMKSVQELVSPALKRRFFICLPKWDVGGIENDIFGMSNLSFPVDNLGETPKYLSGDFLSYIVALDFKAKGDEPYNPLGDSKNLGIFCESYKDGYLIPLYLISATDALECKRMKQIVARVKVNVTSEITDIYDSIVHEEDKIAYAERFLTDEELSEENGDFAEALNYKFDSWWGNLEKYLQICKSKVNLNQIIIEESQRGRAIDIYENLNRGGISLNTFDLIMAKVAKVNQSNFLNRLAEYMHRETVYSDDVIPDIIETELKKKSKFSATIKLGCYDESKNEISSKYIDAFLDVLSLYCYNPKLNSDGIRLEYIKRNRILELKPEDIDSKSVDVCTALDRALLFLYVRCGIRKITDVNNLLILVLLSYIFIKEEYFNNKKIHGLLEAWYWSVLFCGEFDKDQNKNLIKYLVLIMQVISGENDGSWLRSLQNSILSVVNYSDKELLLYKKIDDERYPKKIIGSYICQYFLAQTYKGIFDNQKIISTLIDEQLDAHHIIPLGSVKKIGQVSSKLRKDTRNICNSPINFVYITSVENKAISDKNVSDYIKEITPEAKTSLLLSMMAVQEDGKNDTYDVLSKRFDSIQGAIRNRVSNLLSAYGI